MESSSGNTSEGGSLGILIMAAGKGTRMKSDLPKVLHYVLDRPMLEYLLKTTLDYADSENSPNSPNMLVKVAVLVGHQGERVRDYLKDFPSVEVLWQTEQLGTGHAVKTTRQWWESFDNVLIVNGDLPLLSLKTLRSFIKEHTKAKAAASLLTFETDSPDGYGRVLRLPYDKKVFIVEHELATPEQRRVRVVNAGCYLFSSQKLTQVIDRLKIHGKRGEYYLPDVIGLMNDAGMSVRSSMADEAETMGINTQKQLAMAAARVRDTLVERWMERGVHITDPSSVWIGHGVVLGPEVMLLPGVQIWGKSVIGEGSFIGPCCILNNARLGQRVHLTAHVIVENSELSDNVQAGPFAYIREESILQEGAFAGKFVEVKKSTVGQRSKIPHLSYIGDATLGEDVNVGAGTITCNYDGKDKFPTKIGDRVFLGSDTMLVAPVTLGDDSATAAGSTITTDVPDGALGVARARQKNIEGWTARKKGKAKETEAD